MTFQVRIVFKNGEQRIARVSDLSEIQKEVIKCGYGLDMIRTIHFGW